MLVFVLQRPVTAMKPRVGASSRGLPSCEHRPAPARCGENRQEKLPDTAIKSSRNSFSGDCTSSSSMGNLREEQVQALLRGDLSVIVEPLHELHEQVVLAHRMILSSRAGPCPEYEHFRATMETRRRHRTFADDQWSRTSSDMAVASGSASDSHSQRSSFLRDEQRQQQDLGTINGPSRLEYQWFRSKMRDKQRQKRERFVDDSGSCSGIGLHRKDERSVSVTGSNTRNNNENESLPSLVDDSFLQQQQQHQQHQHRSRVVNSPKRLGEVRDLLGTVLGKAPPSNSPFHFVSAKSNNSATAFSDSESIEVIFE